jgi:hypothetical protein
MESRMQTATIAIDAGVKARLTDLAAQIGQPVEDLVDALLRRVADAETRFEHGVPVFPARAGAPVLTVEDVDRLASGDET